MVLLTCDQSALDMVRRRWPLGTPGTPAPAPPRPQGLDETLSAQRRCSQNERQSESSLGLSLAMVVPSCAASGVETPSPEPPPEAAPRPPPLPTLKTLQQCGAQPLPHTPRQGPPSPAGNSTTHALTTVSLFRASSRTQTDAEVVPHRTPKAGIFNPPAYIDTRLSTVSNLATLVPADPADGPHRVL